MTTTNSRQIMIVETIIEDRVQILSECAENANKADNILMSTLTQSFQEMLQTEIENFKAVSEKKDRENKLQMRQMLKEELKLFQEENLNVKGLVGRDEQNKTAGRLLLRLSDEQQRLAVYCENIAQSCEKSFE